MLGKSTAKLSLSLWPFRHRPATKGGVRGSTRMLGTQCVGGEVPPYQRDTWHFISLAFYAASCWGLRQVEHVPVLLVKMPYKFERDDQLVRAVSRRCF